jgi:hypothetical protein
MLKARSKLLLLLASTLAASSWALDKPLSSSSSASIAQASVLGTLHLAPGLSREKISKTAALYVIARKSGKKGGPPIAVKRITQPFRFPIQFELSSKDAMMPDVSFDGEGLVEISARISQSGSATPVSKGDFGVSRAQQVDLSKTRRVILALDRILP